MVAKAPVLNSGKKLSNLHKNYEGPWISSQDFIYFFLFQNYGVEKFMFPNVKKALKLQTKNSKYNTVYIMLKSKLQIEMTEDPAGWTKLVILRKLSVTLK